jgi:hypothetical protein
MLERCPCFTSNPSGSQDADDGKERHRRLAEALKSDSEADLDEDGDGAAIQWARDYLKATAPLSDYPLVIENKLTLLDDDFNEVMSGTPDQVCGNVIFDFKWRPRDYTAQMAAYALMVMQQGGFDRAFVKILFGATKSITEMEFTEESAGKIVGSIVKSANDPNLKPSLNDYCSWCANILTCPAVLAQSKTVAKGYDEREKVTNWHPSEMETGEQIADALWIAKKILKPWCKSIEYHAKEAVIKRGLSLPGFELGTRQAKKYVSSVTEAYKLLGLPQDKFLECCDVRLNTPQKSPNLPDRLGLDKALAAFRGIKVAAAKRESVRLLASVIKQANPSTVLKMTGDTEEEEEGEE